MLQSCLFLLILFPPLLVKPPSSSQGICILLSCFLLFVNHWTLWGLFTGRGGVVYWTMCLLPMTILLKKVSHPPINLYLLINAQGVMGPHEPLLLPWQASDRTNHVDILRKQITAAVSSRVRSCIMTKSQHSLPLMIAPAPSCPILRPLHPFCLFFHVVAELWSG